MTVGEEPRRDHKHHAVGKDPASHLDGVETVIADPAGQDGIKGPDDSGDERQEVSQRLRLEFSRRETEHADPHHGDGESHEVHHPKLFFAAGYHIGKQYREKRRDGCDDADVGRRRMGQSDIFQ